MNKIGLVKDFSMSNGFIEVNWADFFICPLLDREINMVVCLKEAVSSKILIPEEEDRLIWIHDNNGVFSLKKLTELLIKDGVVDISFDFDKIWKLKVPPRVRSFLWLVSIDRLPTKEFLIRRGVVKSLWMISVSAACWPVWLARNELVFDRKWPTISSLVFHSKIRALMWIRSVHEELKVDERIWWVCPYRSRSNIKKSGLSGRFWCPLSFGWVKFNICGVEIEDEVGCGGMLRDSDGMTRELFSIPFTTKDSLTVEVGVISMALDVYLAMEWKGKSSLIIEAGSIEVFNWVENKGLRPWLLFSLFKEVEIRLSRIGNVSFSKADKHGNKITFALAVAGLKIPGMFKVLFWFEDCLTDGLFLGFFVVLLAVN
ncbi:hypothetical protein J1N35_024037 [Gossypium stocksii]|uniref:Reverse transcriptase zinc-binding domain-containing protein n=1 Tax=Gossypium stocksii TaxID=47602 RepID=A0A9D4A2M5_9ROSI|nr:hypothetical protein J1N35_024037 [Gossypium stocksii]